MRLKHNWILAVLLFSSVFALSVSGQNQSHSSITAGGYIHTDHSVYTDLPYGNGDISYMLAYEYAERLALWQLGVGFAPHVTGTRDEDSAEDGAEPVGTDLVVTPQLNLLFKDRWFRGGTGILGSYIRNDDGEGDWIGPYWQLLLGLDFELSSSFAVGGNAHYVMKNWDDIVDFKFGDIEYSVLLSYRF
jgi:hypothetical protein